MFGIHSELLNFHCYRIPSAKLRQAKCCIATIDIYTCLGRWAVYRVQGMPSLRSLTKRQITSAILLIFVSFSQAETSLLSDLQFFVSSLVLFVSYQICSICILSTFRYQPGGLFLYSICRPHRHRPCYCGTEAPRSFKPHSYWARSYAQPHHAGS